MKLGRLPQFFNKKDDAGNELPNIVKITNAVRNKEEYKDKKDENGKPIEAPAVEFKIPAEEFEFPIYESLAEFIASAGGDELALKVVNNETLKSATSAGKSVIRTATQGTPESIKALGLKASREFTWKVEEVMSIREKASAFDQLAALKETLPQEEFQRRMMEFFAKA